MVHTSLLDIPWSEGVPSLTKLDWSGTVNILATHILQLGD